MTLSASKGTWCTLSASKGGTWCTLSASKGGTWCTLSSLESVRKGGTWCTLSSLESVASVLKGCTSVAIAVRFSRSVNISRCRLSPPMKCPPDRQGGRSGSRSRCTLYRALLPLPSSRSTRSKNPISTNVLTDSLTHRSENPVNQHSRSTPGHTVTPFFSEACDTTISATNFTVEFRSEFATACRSTLRSGPGEDGESLTAHTRGRTRAGNALYNWGLA